MNFVLFYVAYSIVQLCTSGECLNVTCILTNYVTVCHAMIFDNG